MMDAVVDAGSAQVVLIGNVPGMADINETVAALSGLADSIRSVDLDTAGSAVSDLREAFGALGDSDRLTGVNGVEDDLGTVRSLLDQAADRLREWA
jgi:hypothetical protein